MPNYKKIFVFISLFILTTYFFILGLFEAKAFFIPLVTAVILSLLMLPLSRKLEKFMGRTPASLICTFIIFIISVGFFAIVSLQMRSFADDWPKIVETMKPKVESFKDYVFANTPVDEADFKNIKDSSFLKSLSGNSGKVTSFVGTITTFLSSYLLTFIYVFFLISYRKMFKNFILKVLPNSKSDKINETIVETVKVVPQYLIGKLILMGLLAVLYIIGLGISGVQNFVLVGVIASLLTLIPYIGNIIGFGMAIIFGYLFTGSFSTLIGIVLTFSIAQFLESYILQPYVVGDRVDVHPFVIIIGVIAGNYIWGIMGMILAIPIIGIITVILLKIEKLKDLGILMSNQNFKDTD